MTPRKLPFCKEIAKSQEQAQMPVVCVTSGKFDTDFVMTLPN
jgi:hypothetical protein